MSEYVKIPLNDVHVDDKENSRGSISPLSVNDLAEDIRQHGLLQPVIVRIAHPEDNIDKKYILVAGFRRTLAHRVLGLTEIEAKVCDISPLDAIIINFSENLMRESLDLCQESEVIGRLTRMGLNRTEIAKKIGKPNSWIQPRQYLAQMEPEIQKLAKLGVFSAENIRQLWAYKDTDQRFEVARQIRDRREAGLAGQIKIKPPRPKQGTANLKKHRSRSEILNVLDHLVETGIPMGLWTRALAWCSGEITDTEFGASIQEYCKDMNVVRVAIDEAVASNVVADTTIDLADKWGLQSDVMYFVNPTGFPETNAIPR
jgi:ParB/RepB/Spo0J family partition protein